MALILIISKWCKIHVFWNWMQKLAIRTLLFATYFDVRYISDRKVAPDRKQRLHYPAERRPIISSMSCSAAVKNQSPPAASPVWPLSAPCVLTGRHEAESRLVSATTSSHTRTLRTPPSPLVSDMSRTTVTQRTNYKVFMTGHGNKRKRVNPFRFWSGVKIQHLNQKKVNLTLYYFAILM